VIGRLEGKSFEELFMLLARLNGLFVQQSLLTARMLPGGKLRVIPGELDFKLATREGAVGFFDAKSFDSDKVMYSQLSSHQVERSKLYNEWNIPSGFVVFLRRTKSVFFFSGNQVAEARGTSLKPEEGLFLGPWNNFSPKLLLQKKGAPALPTETPQQESDGTL
jgi:hypothetical protein